MTFNFDASSALVLQIQGGAPVDVFASADEANMDKLVDGGQVTAKPVHFARNQLEIAVKPGNPENVTGLADLADVGIVAAVCARGAVRQVRRRGALDAPGSRSRSIRSPGARTPRRRSTAVSAGDAERRDRLRHRREGRGLLREGRQDPAVREPDRDLPDRAAGEAANPKAAKAFSKYVASPVGQKILRKYGFLTA